MRQEIIDKLTARLVIRCNAQGAPWQLPVDPTIVFPKRTCRARLDDSESMRIAANAFTYRK
jgi:hypothetical protein